MLTRGQAKAIRLDIDLMELLAEAERERISRGEDGYNSDDGSAGVGEESEDEEHELPPLDPEFLRMIDELELDIYAGDLTDDDDAGSEGDWPDLSPSRSVHSLSMAADPSHNMLHPPIPTSSLNIQCSSTQKRKRRVRNQAQKDKKHAYKKRRRNVHRAETSHGKYDKGVSRKRVEEAEVVQLDFEADILPISSTGFQGKRTRSLFKHLTRNEVLARTIYYNWDATYDLVICDREGRGLVYCLANPRDPQWNTYVHPELCRILEKARVNGKFTAKEMFHRRGDYVAQTIGYSHGGGQTCPSNTKHSKRNAQVLQTLLSNDAVQRVSGLVNSGYRRFCPEMYAEYKANDEALRSSNPTLRKNFPDSVFAATTFNLGPQTVTPDHVDHGNNGPGGCAITSAGDFDDAKGGELVLWDLGIVIRFPPGSSIIILSAILRHSNLPIQPGEKRYSITQYSAGALFRFAANGMKNDKDYLPTATPEQVEEYIRERRTRWEKSLKKFTTYTPQP
ncbi:hypothetical protein GYMLUDRAFT_51398 [Collybiopsis luxurians FD-317 M1]|uniref:Unplaced genomic scaffold GYMLUscaffold_184, whole genome shotgun sequence n=1 Tax=Collybiopsis luxurians FD-317 M1 TaxID=944289 RepID=A0A0D0B7N6_9AGAR|nr:hypothetical protein GYMLUDRAFT_51398 [Collybiopsis luxurians FD-317 M1]